MSSSESTDNTQSVYDARGLLVSYNTARSVWNAWDQNVVWRFYSGDGREVKRTRRVFTEDLNQTTPPYGKWSDIDPIYYIRSSVLGVAVISEVGPTGKKVKTYVYAAGTKLAV